MNDFRDKNAAQKTYGRCLVSPAVEDPSMCASRTIYPLYAINLDVI